MASVLNNIHGVQSSVLYCWHDRAPLDLMIERVQCHLWIVLQVYRGIFVLAGLRAKNPQHSVKKRATPKKDQHF